MTRQSEEGESTVIVQEIEIWSFYKMIINMNSESVIEKETHYSMILTQTDRQISARRLDLVIVNKIMEDFAVQTDHRVILKEDKIKRQVLGPCLRKKEMEHEGNDETNCHCWSKKNYQKFFKREERVGKLQHDWDRPEYCEE